MAEYRFVSRNTIDLLSLHDCVCSDMRFVGADMVFEMQWMEVLATHPDNPFAQAHQSGQGRIVLHEPVIEQGVLIKGDKNIPIGENAQIRDFEVLEFDEERAEGGFELSLYGISVGEPKADFIQMKIRYSSSEVMFNELGGESWFETFESMK